MKLLPLALERFWRGCSCWGKLIDGRNWMAGGGVGGVGSGEWGGRRMVRKEEMKRFGLGM